MSGWKKLAAASAAGEALNVEDVFSTYLYTGNSASQPINNGVDLAGEGGMVWLKARTVSYNNIIVDSERGSSNGTAYNPLFTNLTNAQNTAAGYGVTSFDSNGFTLGPSGQQSISNQGGASYGDIDYASWTFRKAPKFFDIVTWTGTGNVTTNLAHSLGSVPGSIHIKATSTSGSWAVVHRSQTNPSTGNFEFVRGSNNPSTFGLNKTGIPTQTGPEGNITATHFDPRSVGNAFYVNAQGVSYVAYLFAHNDGDGEFGPDGDQDIIKCGSVTANGGAFTVNLGFEPQWVMLKKTSGSGDWIILDSMRGVTADGVGSFLVANSTSSTQTSSSYTFFFDSTGLRMDNFSSGDYIYMAIRRGPMAVGSAAEVFKALTYGGNNSSQDLDVGFPVDTVFIQNRTKNYTYNNWAIDRVRGSGKQLYTDLNNQQQSDGSYKHLDNNFGLEFTGGGNLNGLYTGDPVPYIGYFYREAAGFFDVVPFTAGTSANRRLDHNLGVAPEMAWVKRINGANRNWYVYNKDLGDASYGSRDYRLYLNTASGKAGPTYDIWGTSDPTATDFGLNENDVIGGNGAQCIAYLFATLDGISKVGSYTGNGSSQTIDCGFTSGASFIMIKRVDSTGNWYQWDTARGIVAGNDPYLGYNISGPTPENNSYDSVDPNSSGFNVVQNSGTNINVNGVKYIFHAIA